MRGICESKTETRREGRQGCKGPSGCAAGQGAGVGGVARTAEGDMSPHCIL